MREALARAGEFVEPVPPWLLDQHDFVDRTAAFRGIHVPEAMAEAEAARRRLVFDELLRIQLALVLRKRRIEATSRGIEHDTSGRAGATGSSAALPFALTGDQRSVIARDHGRPGPSASRCTACCRATSGAGKTVVAVAALLDRGAGRPPGRAHGPHRGAGRAAPPRHPPPARRASPCPTTAASPVRRAAAHRRAAHQPGHRQGAPAGPRRAGRRRGRPARRHPRADPGGRGVPLASASSSSTSSTASASSSAPRCGTRPVGARCPTCSS